MPIKFPKIHIAESVTNRILNIADGLPSVSPGVAPVPLLPNVAVQSVQLDTQLKTPPGPAELPAGADGAVVGAALSGEDLVSAAIEPAL